MSEIELLEKIVKNTKPKTSFQIIVSSNSSSFSTRFIPSIELDRDKVYEIALVNLETFYAFPNIDNTNNIFVYSPDNGLTREIIEIPTSSYEISDINDTIQVEMKNRGHYDEINNDFYITLSANSNTLKSVLNIESGYQVYFNQVNNMSKVLGFTGDKY